MQYTEDLYTKEVHQFFGISEWPPKLLIEI